MSEEQKIESSNTEEKKETAAPVTAPAATDAKPATDAAPATTPAAKPAGGYTPRPAGNTGRPQGNTGRPQGDRPYRPKREFGDGNRMPRFKRKVCRFCHDKNATIDYKQADVLLKFVTDRGKILPRRVTGTCAKHQRAVAREIKRARTIALLPFIEM